MNLKTFGLGRKPSPETALEKLSEALHEALGQQLESLVVFGSYAGPDFHPDRSNINVLLVIKDVSLETLQAISPAVRQWTEQGQPLPVIFQRDELESYARHFPIEFLDMQQDHKVIRGEDVVATLPVPTTYLQAQCAHELSQKQLLLRQRVALSKGTADELRNLMVESLPSILSLFRAGLRMRESGIHLSKLEAGKRLAQTVGLDGSDLETIDGLKMRREIDYIPQILRRYLDLIERVTQELAKA